MAKDNFAQTSCDENKFAVMGKRHLITLCAFFVSFEDCTGIAWVDKVDPIILRAVSIPEEHKECMIKATFVPTASTLLSG